MINKKQVIININYLLLYIYFRVSVHSLIVESEALELKRWPSSQFPEFAFSFSNSPLCPNPDDADVQNGITVFPVKSFSFTKLSTGQAAIPPPYWVAN